MDGSTTPVILCVDDDKVTLRAIERSLVSNGYLVLTADSGARALTTLQKTKPNLILLDAVMPNMDGYEVCSHLQTNPVLATIPVIFVTAQEEGEERARALSLGAADYLVKPIQRDILLRKVALHINNATVANTQKSVLAESTTAPALHVVPEPQPQSAPIPSSAPLPALVNGKHDVATDAPTWDASLGQVGEVLLQAHELEQLIEERTLELRQANVALQAELSRHREAEDALRRAHDDLERRLLERSAEFDQLQTTLHDDQATRLVLEESLRQLQDNLDRQAQEHAETLAQAQIKGETEREARQQAETALHQLQEDLEHRLQEQTSEVEKLQSSLREEQTIRQALEESLEHLHEDVERQLQEQNASLEQATTSLQAELAERRLGEEKLIHALHEQEILTQALPDALFVVDRVGNLHKWNRTLENASGYTGDELAGSAAVQLFPEEERDRIATIFSPSYNEHQRPLEAALLRKDGSMALYQWNVARMMDADDQITSFVVTGRDLTDRKQVELSLQLAKDAAEQSSQAKSEFLANMSHEIRTPMNGVIGMTELLLDSSLTSEQREYAETVKSSADALLALLNDILDFSKIEARKLDLESVNFSLRENLGDAMRALAFRAHQRDLELLYEVATDAPDIVIGDSSRLRQVVTNLVGNALKFTEKGEVSVRVEKIGGDENEVELRFAVRDTGIGIPKDKQHLIFQAFSQADVSINRKYGGTGLGLAISTQLVRLMNGYLWLESEENQGSTFYFTVRLGLGTPKEKTPPAALEELHGLPVLVVDDNATNRRILNDVLLAWHMVPYLADSADSALAIMNEAKAKAKAEAFAFVLIDGHMPGTDGYTLAQQITATPTLTGATLMMLTSSDQKEERDRYQQMGLSGFMLKPIRPSELLTALLKARGKIIQETRKSKTPFTQKSQRTLRLLVAEDNAVNQKLAVRFLQKWEHEAVVATNGKEAYDTFLHKGPFDAILMDVEMPIMNGMETTAAIREHERSSGTHIAIIAMTAHAMVGDKERCLSAGMDGYISKPLRAEELFATLEQVAQQSGTVPVNQDLEAPPRQEEIFDRTELLSLVDGDVVLLTELTDLFWESSPMLMEQIRAAVNDNDPHTLAYAVHTLKGSVGNFAAKQALATIAQLEQMGTNGHLEQAALAVDRLEVELARLREALSSLKAELAA